MANPQILQLDVSGVPYQWLSYKNAAILYAKNRVAWTFGNDEYRIMGGTQRTTGLRSFFDLDSIIAVKEEKARGNRDYLYHVPRPAKQVLFARDKNMCAYCGHIFKADDLTQDHIIPQRAGGESTWMNLVAACKPCNHRKDDKTPRRAGMELVYIPYVPSRSEWLILQNRRILADQMEFLMSQVPETSRLKNS